MRLTGTFLFSTVAVLLGAAPAFAGPVAAPAAAAVGCPGGGLPGTLTITEKKLEPSDANNLKLLKAEQRCVIVKPKDEEGWTLYIVAHLNRPPGADSVNLVLFDQAQPATPGNEVQAYPLRTKKDAKVLMATAEIKPEEGFKAGGKYNILLTRLVGGKQEVYAKTTVELK